MQSRDFQVGDRVLFRGKKGMVVSIQHDWVEVNLQGEVGYVDLSVLNDKPEEDHLKLVYRQEPIVPKKPKQSSDWSYQPEQRTTHDRDEELRVFKYKCDKMANEIIGRLDMMLEHQLDLLARERNKKQENMGRTIIPPIIIQKPSFKEKVGQKVNRSQKNKNRGGATKERDQNTGYFWSISYLFKRLFKLLRLES